jgi:signal transduction histidine kinase
VNASRRRGARRALEVGFLVLLVFSTAQVVWWLFDQNRLARLDHTRVVELYRTEAELARTLLAEGRAWSELAARFPHVVLADGAVAVSPDALAALDAERAGRLRRYGWEGGFFLAVLVASMWVVGRALHEEAQLQRRQENFLAAVSHEFKSPLASLQLSLDTIRLRAPAAERLRELVERMAGDVDRLERLVTELLDTASLESGRREMVRERVALAEVARAVAEELAGRARLGNVVLSREIDEGLTLDADPVAVRTVVANLVDNAVRATQAGGGGRVTLAAEEADGEVRLRVVDTGVGFPPEEAKRLFQKFYRLGDELRRTGRGTGLGLYIVARLMELERGRFAAESDGPGRGATFTVAWPRARAAAPEDLA